MVLAQSEKQASAWILKKTRAALKEYLDTQFPGSTIDFEKRILTCPSDMIQKMKGHDQWHMNAIRTHFFDGNPIQITAGPPSKDVAQQTYLYPTQVLHMAKYAIF
mgnify:CR=1 FL=1